jgi:hypothetical protein
MRRSSSTTTSAPTDTGEERQYFFMSPELEETLDLEPSPQSYTSWSATVNTKNHRSSYDIVSIEDTCDGGYIMLLKIEGQNNLFTLILLESLEFSVCVHDLSFKAKVLKLESDRAYLKLSR